MSSTLAWAGPMEDFKAAAAAQERGDYVTALRMFQALADQKIPGGLWAMGAMYAEGKGVTQDYAVAANEQSRSAHCRDSHLPSQTQNRDAICRVTLPAGILVLAIFHTRTRWREA